jgi:DNA ligase D-like protein (predicted ligase)
LYEPMLAAMGSKGDLELEGYIFEPKLDGTRALCYVNSTMKFLNRRGNDITERYPEFSFRDQIKARSCVLDGELIVYDNRGNPSFHLLQKREQSKTSIAKFLSIQHPATYVIFDIMELEGKSLLSTRLEERKRIMHAVLREGHHLQSIAYTKDGAKLWSVVEQRKLEGVMAKRYNSYYEPGKRSDAWLKIKALKTVDCVLLGYTSEIRAISALALGLFFGNELRYVGRVGTGFTEKYLEELRPILDDMLAEKPPVSSYPNEPTITWVRPELIAEVKVLTLTRDNHLRAPSFRRLRNDKNITDCIIEQLGKVSVSEQSNSSQVIRNVSE